MCGHPDPFRSVRDLGPVPPGCPRASGASRGCSSVWLPAWLPRPYCDADDPLLRRSVCAADQPSCPQVSRCIRLSGSDRKFPALTGRSGTQRARQPFVPNRGAAGYLVRQPESSTIRSMPFHQGNMMSNKPHLRPHQKKRQTSRITRLIVGILILAIFALVIALEATGRVEFRGRLILLRGGRWLLTWWSPGVRASRAGLVLRPVQGPCVPTH